MKKFLKIIVFILICAAIFFVVSHLRKSRERIAGRYAFRTEAVEKSSISRTISASGTVEPEELVNVGAQVSGKIMSFGTDADGGIVDYRSTVKAGMVLAQIDDVLYAAELRQCKAEKLQAEAAIITANAAIRQAKAKENLASLNWARAKQLYDRSAMSKSDYDAAESTWISALADSAAANAQLKQAEAQLAIAEAALIKAQRNMDYCVITSPVDGIIIDRRVSIGQTVVSNMSASSIFLIAKEFKKMQVWVSVNEADIGSIRQGMAVEFTVDAFPESTFYGEVEKVRLNATMSQNVVTYIVEVVTDNADGKLLPYLTANVKFIIDSRDNVLNVSNAALRFNPPKEIISEAGLQAMNSPLPDGCRRLWIRDGVAKLRPLTVKTGLNAGGRTEIIDGELKEGDQVIFALTELKEGDSDSDETRSPFMPTPPKRAPRGSGSAADRARSQHNSGTK